MKAAIGIDVSRDRLDVALVEAGHERPTWRQQVPRTPAGIAKLLRKTPPGVPWVMEPTGRYSQEVALQVRDGKQQVLLAPTKAARHVLQALRPNTARTDQTDCVGLAHFAMLRPLRDYPLRSESMDEIDQLVKTRRALAATVSRLRMQQASLPRAARCFDGPLAALEAQVAELERELARRARVETELAVVAELQRVPGIGPITAMTVASCLATKQFEHPDQFVSYCGLHLVYKDSGQKQARRKLSKHGDGELRRLLYLAAMANVRCLGSPFGEQYQRELAKPGMNKTGALCAVSRKLAKVCWSIHRHQTTYDPARVYCQGVSEESEPTP